MHQASTSGSEPSSLQPEAGCAAEPFHAANAVWCAAPDGAFEWREWDGLIVAFVHATGDTHALSPDGSIVLGHMIEHRHTRLSAEAWWQRMTAEAERSHPANEDLEGFQRLLVGLESFGLVQRFAQS